MAPTTTKTTTPKTHTRLAEDAGSSELAQQFKTVKDYASYVLARMQQADPDATIDTLPVEGDVDETETEVRPRKEKRVKGRRRAANPVAPIEASLRRQSELKSNFRSLARPLKGVLDEMARRTTESLESDSHAHEQAAEHSYVQEDLQHALDERIAVINRRGDFQRAQLEERRNAEEQVLRSRYTQSVSDMQDRYIDGVDHRMLQIERQSHMADPPADHDTEDEDDVLLQPHHMSYRYNRGSAIPPQYDSRSRLALDVEEAHEHLGARQIMRDMLREQSFQPEDEHTVMDPAVRDAAVARRHGMESIEMLARATQQVESETRVRRRKQTPVIQSRAHRSLMDLADAAVRSRSQHNDMPPPQTPLRRQFEYDERGTAQSGVNSGRKRARSDAEDLESPYAHRPIHGPNQHSQYLAMPNAEPDIKEEQAVSPGAHYAGPRAAALLPSALDTARSDDVRSVRHRLPFEPFDDTRYERQSSVLSRASTDRRSFANMDGHNGTWNDAMQQSPLPGQILASPFTHHASPMFSRPPTDYDGRFRPMGFGRRPMLQHPPMPPTAPPINHFANSGAHRNSFGSYAQRPPSTWSSISPTPLVALPYSESPRMPSHASPLDGASFPQFQHQHIPGVHDLPPAPAPSQYGGPTLAPAAGPYHTPQPAFAQHLCRQQVQQNRRRNTDAIVPRFKEYRGPS
ncbi:hypothetical protein AMS68_007326 [Peltaster fructicola]|uniref:Uncharacterized protein n=1 Tax=Peltaster fructicola TaxID=286661 RepID=A0A6H0Y4N5_9PEZI|nr:hypothetical protein AMS68_007326 [Peltaster fructicola]